MDNLVLEPDEAAVRAAEKQVSVLLELYREQDTGLPRDFADKRQQSLTGLRGKLRSILAERDRLPGAPNPEAVELSKMIERLRGLLKDEPFEVPIAQETRLVELCDELAEVAPDIGEKIAPEHIAAKSAIEELSRLD